MLRMICLVVLLILVPIPQSAFAGKMPGKMGVYVSFRDEIGSPYKLRQVMRQMKAAGIDFILPSAKSTSGIVNWDSSVAPPDLIGNKTYMDTVVKYAHAEGLKVYPVVCVCTEGGDSVCNALLKKNPSWSFYFEGGRRGYIDPGNPDARKYEVALMAELVAKYDVDGLSLDYMRCPNRVGYTDTGRAYFLKKHKVDLAKIVDIGPVSLDTEGGKKALADVSTSARQNPVWPEWQSWRRQKLNVFMGEIEAAVHKAKPGLPISSYCWGAHTYVGNFETCQDWKTWIAKGWLDWINPSGYRYTDESFMTAAKLNRENVPKGFPYYITIGVLTSHGALPTAGDIKRQMTMSKDAGADGLIFFTWESFRKFVPETGDALKVW